MRMAAYPKMISAITTVQDPVPARVVVGNRCLYRGFRESLSWGVVT